MIATEKEQCQVAIALNAIGDRWTLRIIAELVKSKSGRFQDLERALGIAPNTLSARLKRLEELEIVDRQLYDSRPPRAEYLLTEKGMALRPIIKAMKKWTEQFE